MNLFAGGLEHVRWMTVAENGDVLLAEPGVDKITLRRDVDGDGKAELRETFLHGLNRPHGLAIHGGYLYIGKPTRNLKGASFEDVTFRNADFRDAVNIGDCTFTGAKGLDECLFDNEGVKEQILRKASSSSTQT